MERRTMGALIAALQRANGMTQKELAEKLNVSDKTVSRWERDEGTPDLALIPAIAEIFGVTCDELLRGERRPPEERGAEAPAPRGEKQRKRLLASGLSRYRTRSAVSMGLAAAGLIAAMACNFAFLRSYIGFAAAAICALAAVVCQTAFVNSALLAVADEELDGEETDRYKCAVVRRAEGAVTLTVTLLAFSLPLLLKGDAYAGLTAASWLPAGVVCALLALILCGAVCCALNGSLRKKGVYPVPAGEEPVWLHNRLWLRRCAVGLAAVLAVTLLAHAVAFEMWNANELAPALVFTDIDEFVAFMERDEEPSSSVYSGSFEVPLPAGEEIWYDENGNEISEEEALTQTMRDSDGNVICTYVCRNRTVSSIRYSTGDTIRVVTYDALRVGQQRHELLNAGFAVLYCAETIAALIVYMKMRKKA